MGYTSSSKHQTIIVYRQLPRLIVNLRTPLGAGRWKMALRLVTYEGIRWFCRGIASKECDALSLTTV